MASLKSLLCTKKPWLTMGRVVTHAEAPFSVAHSMSLFCCWISCCLTSCASASCFSHLDFQIEALVHFHSSVADQFRSWTTIRATRDAVTCLDDSNSDCEFEDGLNRPRPQNVGGSASSRHSKREQGGCPVMAGWSAGGLSHPRAAEGHQFWEWFCIHI